MNDIRLLAKTDRKLFCEIRRDYQRRHRMFPKKLTLIPKSEWPRTSGRLVPDECWNSQEFLVQIFRPENQPIRLSISSTVMRSDGGWRDGITWDEMQRVKADVGFASEWAVEIFPPDSEVINVANFRHLWIVPAPDFAWRNGGSSHER